MRLHMNSDLSGQIARMWRLSVPAILTQITSIAMQYIDSAMVGRLGAHASAAIGLVSTSTWLIGGLGSAISVGFSVQVAHHIGAGHPDAARRVVKHGLLTALAAALLMMTLGICVSNPLPRWLDGDPVLWHDASAYFLVFCLTLPFMELNWLVSAFLQCSGNMVVPSILNSLMCVLDVVFNAIFIPRYGVLGAAVGTGLATAVVSLLMLWFCCIRSESLRINRRESCPLDISILRRAVKIGTPVGTEQIAMSAAMVVSTMIIAPLGSVAIAANAFAVTAEGLCYMPGYGVASAATTLVGQSIGAKDFPAAKRFAHISVAFGCLLMTLTGVIMFIGCPLVFQMLTPDPDVQQVATQIIRIELFAEPLFAVSMVSAGALRGAADTLVPSILNLLSIWVVRLGLSMILVGSLGIHGVWIAMAVELSIRGLLLLYRLQHSTYLKQPITEKK